MGWGGKGKGKGWAPAMPGPMAMGAPAMPGPAVFHHHRHHRHHGGIGVGTALEVAAEAALVGGAAAAVVAASTRPRRRPPPQLLPPQQVVVLPSGGPVYSQPQQGYVVQPPKGKGKGKGPPQVIVAQPEPPLAITSVCLPPGSIEQRGTVTFFWVEVMSESGSRWRVMRRYNEFLALQRQLGPSSENLPGAPFPGKSFLKCSGEKLEVRRRGLEIWIGMAIRNPNCAGPWLRPLRQFLEAGREMIAPGPVVPTSAPGQAAPVAPPAAAPPLPAPATGHSDAPAGVAEDDDGNILEIEIPAGINAGQLLAVTVPDGRQVNVAVPEGYCGGSKLELWYDSVTGTLTPLTSSPA